MATIPSISLIPSGYKAGKVYSVLPTDGSGDLTFARASTATRINKNNLIENVGNNVPRLDYEGGGCPSLLLEPSSTNLITQSEAFGNSYWTKSGATVQGDPSTAGSEKVVNGDFASDTWWGKDPSWTIGGGSASSNGSGTIYKGGVLTIGKTYLVSFDISSYTSGSLAYPSGGFSTPSSVGTYSFTYQASSQTISFSGSSFVGSIDNVSVKEVQGFSAPSADSPLGAFKLVEDTSVAANHRIDSQNLSVVASGSITISVILKYDGSREWVKVRDFATNAYVFFNLLDNSIGNTNLVNGSQKIVDLGNGFKRVSFTYSSTLTTAQVRIYLADSGTSDGYTGNGTSGVYIFGAQLEQKSYATSYIKTSGSQITRLAETASKSGLSASINSTQGVLYAEMSALSNDSTNRQITLSDGSDTNRIVLKYDNQSNIIQSFNRVGGVETAFLSASVSDITSYSKIAVKYKLNSYALWIDGIEVSTDLSSTTFSPNVLNDLSLSGGSSGFYGKVKDLKVYKTALTSLEIETLTSYSSFNEMALALNYKIQ